MKTREIDLRKLNSITKYPSIPTYHALGEKGRLTEEVLVPFNGEKAYGSEKIDGTNARIVYTIDEMFIIGSREEFLYGKGDLIINPAQNIVPTILETANRIERWVPQGKLCVYFGEVYGANVGSAAKQYTKSGKTGFRLFDAFALEIEEVERLMTLSLEQISLWREHGNQPFVTLENLKLQAELMGLQMVPQLDIGSLPTSINETHQWLLDNLVETVAHLDGGDTKGSAEGIVVRTADRKKIAKIRHEDYQRTLKVKK